MKAAGWVFQIWEQPELLATPGEHLSRRGPEFQRELQCAENDSVLWKAVNFYFLPKQSQSRCSTVNIREEVLGQGIGRERERGEERWSL